MKVDECLLLFHDHFCLDNLYAASDVVRSTRKVISLNSLSRFSENWRKSLTCEAIKPSPALR